VSGSRYHPIVRAAVPALAGAAAFILAGALWLWTGYGATVFFETIRVGYTACFG
jgi:hypothetical protein